MAKYKEVANEIRKRIKSGIYHSEEKIPDQESLAKEFGTSRVTVKKALDMLSVAGLVYTIQGSGTYVKKNAVNLAERSIQIGQNVGLTAAAGERLELKTEVLDFNVRFPDEEECNQLSITKEEPVYDIKRLRILDEKPYSLEHTIIPIVLAPNITKDILNRSLYDYLQGDLGIVFGDNRKQSARSNRMRTTSNICTVPMRIRSLKSAKSCSWKEGRHWNIQLCITAMIWWRCLSSTSAETDY